MEHIHHLYGLVREVVRKVPWLALIWAIYEVAPAFAGRETALNSNVRLVLTLGANKWFMLVVGSLAGGGALLQRRSKRRSIAGIQAHAKKLEVLVDPKRTSSNLKQDGTAREEDLDGA